MHRPVYRGVTVSGNSAALWIHIAIQDNGPGFQPGFPVFEPFHSTDPSSTGLGLATVKELIEAHGGHIWMTPCEGSRIEMELPVNTEETQDDIA